jgi:hypothetical protein
LNPIAKPRLLVAAVALLLQPIGFGAATAGGFQDGAGLVAENDSLAPRADRKKLIQLYREQAIIYGEEQVTYLEIEDDLLAALEAMTQVTKFGAGLLVAPTSAATGVTPGMIKAVNIARTIRKIDNLISAGRALREVLLNE